jgi:gamma-glutamyltranspeptidase/glutathione hydrolase
MRLALADRDMWIGDPRYSNVPARQLLAPSYLAARSTLISGNTTMCSPVEPGNPFAQTAAASSVSESGDVGDAGIGMTSHYTIIDKWGNVVVMIRRSPTPRQRHHG